MKAYQSLIFFPLLILVALVSSCASPASNSNNKCRKPNWYGTGYGDAANGRNKKNLDQYYANCGPSFIINKAAYDKGWKAGVVMYCNPRNGLKLGMEGKLYNNVCSDHQIYAFDKSWHEGIITYCTAKNGYTRGLQGGNFPGFCPPYANLAFKRFYDKGRRIYLKLKALKDQHTELDMHIQTLKADIKIREKALIALQQTFAQNAFRPRTQYKIQKDKIHIKHLATQMGQLIQQRNATLQKYNALVKAYSS